MNNIITAGVTFRNSSRHPIKFETLHPGSFFSIVSEPSRNLHKLRDARIYRKARDGFYATEIGSNSPAVLYPEDLVMPKVREVVKAG